ncbi:MAG TPA: hypothetical protein VFF73_00695 [Planctomycetota bacterium]|nr:hypothetical protein [Planctomycetota bacterium]
MPKHQGEHLLPHVEEKRGWTYQDPPREGADYRLVYRTSLDEAWSAADWLGGDDDAPKKKSDEDDDHGPTKKRGLNDKLKQLVALHVHEFSEELDGFEEREIRYGDERSMTMLPRLKRKKKKKVGADSEKALARYPWLMRLLPRLVSYDEEGESRKWIFDGWRPQCVHVLSQVLQTNYKFRLEDLAHFATHGDHMLHLLEHLDLGPCLDQDAILYVPSADTSFPWKFVTLSSSKTDNYITFVMSLKRLFDQTESTDTFRDRFFSQIKLGFERFGPACATPEFQEVELRLWTLISYASTRLQLLVAEMAHTMDGAKVRSMLKELRKLKEAVDDAGNLPSELMAFYRTHFNIPFAMLFEHSLAKIDDIAKGIDCRVKERPKDIEGLTELITRFRRLEPTDPIENLEHLEERLEAAYQKVDPPVRTKPEWVRRYNEIIFTGTDKFDQRRYKAGKS